MVEWGCFGEGWRYGVICDRVMFVRVGVGCVGGRLCGVGVG